MDYKDISGILPPIKDSAEIDKQRIVSVALDEHNAALRRRQNAATLAKLKAVAKREELNEAIYGNPSKAAAIKLFNQERLEAATEALENTKHKVAFVPMPTTHESKVVVGTTSYEIQRLLTSLNVNLNVQLTKTDTHNLLATLLTCNEAQLLALQSNKKVPLAIKTVIKRLIDDAAVGNIANIEKLWNRIFGPSMMQVDMPQGYQGIVPNVPVSREAYILIRETLIGHDTQ